LPEERPLGEGKVKAIQAGYAGPAAGGDNRDLEKETTALVERLLQAKNRRDG